MSGFSCTRDRVLRALTEPELAAAADAGDYPVVTDLAAVVGVLADLVLTGEAHQDRFAFWVAGAGDVNGDGYADLLICAGSTAYLLFGYFGPWPETVDVGANLIAGTGEKIIECARKMLESDPNWENPYGNGDAAELTLKNCSN